MAPNYTLHYFNSKGRAEVIRWMFELRGVDYEDRRYSSEEWAEFKPKTPFGQMPVLEVDGKMLCQTPAIVLYLGQELGLMGESSLESAEIAMLSGCIDDSLKPLLEAFYATTDEPKAAHFKNFIENTFPKLLKFINDQIKGKDWYIGSKMTAADLMIARFTSDLPTPAQSPVKDFPDVEALVDKVLNLQAIKSWIAKRPVTEH